MRRFLVGSVAFATVLAFPLCVNAQNNNDKNKPKTTQATDKDYATLGRYSQINGKVVSTDAGKITVAIEHPHQVQNTNSTSGRNRRPSTTTQKDQIEFELPIKEKAVVKKMFVSGGFDEKGNPKSAATTTTDGKKPASAPGGGTLCDITDLIPGTVVRLQLAAPKKSATAAKKDEDTGLDTHPTVTSVTALSEPKEMVASDNGKKKKNQ
jgi:hypothetical protein